MKTYRTMMFIDGVEVASSCVASGNLKICNAAAKRLNRNSHARIEWRVLTSIGA